MKVTEQEVKEFLDKIADLKIWNPNEENISMYVSKIDGSYLCFENNFMDVQWILKAGITEEIQSALEKKQVANIGFNPTEQKWYGWSHRAYHGFGIGHTVKFGSASYKAKDLTDLIRVAVNFWEGDTHANVAGIIATNDKGVEGVQLTWDYVEEKVPNKSLHGTTGETFFYPPKQWGRGEWTATTLEEAKQMAIDFSESVS